MLVDHSPELLQSNANSRRFLCTNRDVLTMQWGEEDDASESVLIPVASTDWVFDDVTQVIDNARRSEDGIVILTVLDTVLNDGDLESAPHLRVAPYTTSVQVNLAAKDVCVYTSRYIAQLNISEHVLVFDNSNWNEVQTVSVRVVNDDVAENAISPFASVEVSKMSSMDEDYTCLNVVVPYTAAEYEVVDNDEAGVLLPQATKGEDVLDLVVEECVNSTTCARESASYLVWLASDAGCFLNVDVLVECVIENQESNCAFLPTEDDFGRLMSIILGAPGK